MRIVTIMAKDRTGLLADISYILGKSKIYIDGVNAGVVGERAIVCLEIKDRIKARKMLTENGYTVSDEKTMVFKMGREKSIDMLREKMDAVKAGIKTLKLLSTGEDEALYEMTADNPKKAIRIFGELGVFCYNC